MVTATLRQAGPQDLDFMWSVYSDVVRPQIVALLNLRWVDDDEKRRLLATLNIDEVRIASVDGADVGWMAMRETDTEFVVDHGYLIPTFRRKGIGSRVLGEIIDTADKRRKPIRLAILQTCQYPQFFTQLGFAKVSEDQITITMTRATPA